MGQNVVSELAASKRIVKVITRHPQRHRHLQVLPGVQLIRADVHNPIELQKHFQGVDAVINLVGNINAAGRNGAEFRMMHVDLVRKIMDACRETNIHRLLHVSTLNADPTNGSSTYLRTKGEGENLVHTTAGDIRVTIFRPSFIFGAGDGFLTRFASMLTFTPVLLLPCPHTRLAPVFVGDVAKRIVASLEDRNSFGKRYDLCGPHTYTLHELVCYTAQIAGRKRMIVALPEWASRLQARWLEYMPGKPFSLDNYHTLSHASVCPHKTLLCETPLEAVAPVYLGHDAREQRLQHFRSAIATSYASTQKP